MKNRARLPTHCRGAMIGNGVTLFAHESVNARLVGWRTVSTPPSSPRAHSDVPVGPRASNAIGLLGESANERRTLGLDHLLEHLSRCVGQHIHRAHPTVVATRVALARSQRNRSAMAREPTGRTEAATDATSACGARPPC